MSHSSLFGFGGVGGNCFGVGVRVGVGGGGEGGLLSNILQDMKMDQSPLYVSQGFDGGGGSG